MKIVIITGSKGKTTVTRAVDHICRFLRQKTLRVDTDGHFVNGKQKSTLKESLDTFNIVPTVCPGKYLTALVNKKDREDYIAILETSIGSSASPGIGCNFHNIGIFLNVYEEHIAGHRIRSQKDIAYAKRFVFENITKDGTCICNADDDLAMEALDRYGNVPKKQTVLYGVEMPPEKIKRYAAEGRTVLTTKGDFVYLIQHTDYKKILDLRKIYWTFNGKYLPSIYNVLAITAVIFSLFEKIPCKFAKAFYAYQLDLHGGRLVIFRNSRNVTIIADYAHEKQSLKHIGLLAKSLAQQNKAIGVIRLAPDRTDAVIQSTGEFIAPYFDHFIIFDKIDGIVRKKFSGLAGIQRRTGEVSQLLYRAIKKSTKNSVENIIVEDDAICAAAHRARSGDVVVVICGDDHRQTIASIKKHFTARRV